MTESNADIVAAIGFSLIARVAAMRYLGHSTIRGASVYWHDLPDTSLAMQIGDGMLREFALLAAGMLDEERAHDLVKVCVELHELARREP